MVELLQPPSKVCLISARRTVDQPCPPDTRSATVVRTDASSAALARPRIARPHNRQVRVASVAGETPLASLRRFLTLNRGAFCDGCLERELAQPGREVMARSTRRLANEGVFYRDRAACSICGRQRRVIKAL